MKVRLTFTDRSVNESKFLIERSMNGGAFQQIATAPAHIGTGSLSYLDTPVAAATYVYRVAAMNAAGVSAYAVSAPLLLSTVPAAPGNFQATNGPNPSSTTRAVVLSWQDLSSNETGFTVQRATNATFTSGLFAMTVGTGVTTLTQSSLSRNTQYWYRIRANNGTIATSDWVNATPLPIRTNP